MSYSVTIELPGLPKMANGGHGHWRADHAAKKRWTEMMGLALLGKIPPKPFSKIKATFIRCSSVEPDFDGMVHGFKPIRDSLKKFGIVIDDKTRNIVAEHLWEAAPRGKGFIRIHVEGIE